MTEFRESKVHSCIFQQKVVEQKFEPNPRKKCRCRQLLTFEAAKEKVRQGEAQWVVERRRRVEREQLCSHCQDESPNKDSCPVCKGLGRIKFVSILDDPGFDIVKLAHHTKSARVSTPRVPTIEAKHILRAYVSNEAREAVAAEVGYEEGVWDVDAGEDGTTGAEKHGRSFYEPVGYVSPGQRRMAAERIDEYGRLINEQLRSLGAGVNTEPGEKRKAYPPGMVTFADGTTNKSWWWEIEGREHDYGRAI